MNINVDRTKRGIEGLSVDLVPNAPEIVRDFAAPDQGENMESHEPALQSINVNQTRSKAIAESHNTHIGLNNQHKVSEGSILAKEVAEYQAIQLMTQTKFKDPRETAFQKLDVLFTDPCL